MKMSTIAHYGLIAAGYIAEQGDEGWVMASTISEKYDIPLEYLFKILQQMRRVNVLRSKKGPRGGFKLARPAKEITLLEIIEAAGGPISSQLELVKLTLIDLKLHLVINVLESLELQVQPQRLDLLLVI